MKNDNEINVSNSPNGPEINELLGETNRICKSVADNDTTHQEKRYKLVTTNGGSILVISRINEQHLGMPTLPNF